MNTSFKLFNLSKKHFSVLPKVPKMELTMRSPYKTFFKDFNGFQRIFINSIKGTIAITNRTYPTMYMLPAGEIKVTGVSRGTGNMTDANSSGEFIHSGGWCLIHE